MSNIEMESVIEDSLNDAVMDTSTDTTTEVTADTTDAADVSTDASVSADDATQAAVDSTDPNATQEQPAVQDEFEKRWGIPARSVTGRENRIPHTRVKSMVTKAEQDGYTRGLKEAETKSAPQLTEFQTKIQDYEGRLTKVAQFENVLENDPKTFLGLLSQIPAYKEFFDYIGQLAQQQPATTTQPAVPDGMPQPDQILTDGTKVYSMDGLQALLAWQSKSVEDRVTKQITSNVEKRYAPIEQEWQQRERMAQMAPVIEKQIADARTWANFAELEPSIITMLKADPNITLERAYVKAYQEQVVPRVSTDRNKIRTELLAELKQKPVSSSAQASQVRPGTQAAGPRSLEQIIADSVRDAGLSGT